jgi:hypothetical protein
MESLPFYKLGTKLRSTPDYFTVGYEMNSTHSLRFQPSDLATSLVFVSLPTKFGTIKIEVRLIDCSQFSVIINIIIIIINKMKVICNQIE